MKNIGLGVNHHGVPGIIPALIAHDVIRVLGQDINQLTLALIPPLETNNYSIHIF